MLQNVIINMILCQEINPGRVAEWLERPVLMLSVPSSNPALSIDLTSLPNAMPSGFLELGTPPTL